MLSRVTLIPRNATNSEMFLHMIKQILSRSNHPETLWIVGKMYIVLVYEAAPSGAHDQLIFQQ